MGVARATTKLTALAVTLGAVGGCAGKSRSSSDGAGAGGANPVAAGADGLGTGGMRADAGLGGSTGGASGRGGVAGTAADAGGRAGTSGSGGLGDASGEAGATTGGAGGAGDATGGSGGSAGAGRAGNGGAPSIDCSGTFGEPRVVLELGSARKLYSPTLNADETELLYAVAADSSGELRYARSTRASKLDIFGPGESMPELDAACLPQDERTIDLSADGLRAYLVCYGSDNPLAHELRVAVRPTLEAPFVLDTQTYGQVGPSAAIATGELTLYTSGFQVSADPALVFTRATTNASFGDGQEIPGLEGVLMVTPDPSADGLSLFGALTTGLVVATRASVDEPFTLEPPLFQSTFGGWVSPTISADCRSLYAVHQSPLSFEVFTR